MKKRFVCFFAAVLLALPVISHATEGARRGSGGVTQGFIGAGTAAGAQTVTVSEAKELGHRTQVTLHGNVVRSGVRSGRYEFRDDSGNIIINIDARTWQGISVDENTAVEIRGTIDRRLASFWIRRIKVESISIL